MSCRLLFLATIYITIISILLPRMRRSQLTHALLEKYANDESHRTNKHEAWYKIDVSRLRDELKPKFMQFYQDDETERFLTSCFDKSDAFLTQLWHALVVPFLKLLMTQTNVNGFLGRGSMFVFSTKQFQKLLHFDDGQKQESLLDLGAGDGKVTEKMAINFSSVYVTELSVQMQLRLSAKGYTVLDIENWKNSKYNVVSCLNVLDRCDKPMTLLHDIRGVMHDENSRLIVASVFPYSPYVENSSNGNLPSEFLRIAGSTVEEQIESFVDVFSPVGFVLEQFSRVPYLCEGDLYTSFYVLHDIVFVFRPV